MGKSRLGRGLGAILDEVEKAYETNSSYSTEAVVELSVDSIAPNPYQPRKSFDGDALEELASSIKQHGLLQPIIVYEEENDYILIAGERRLRATRLAGFDTIKAIVADIESKKLRELALIENIQREELNPIELAHSYEELIEDYGITHEELAARIGKSRAQISNTIRLLSLNSYTKKLLQENKLSQGHAKILVALDSEEQKLAADTIIGQKLSVRESEQLIGRMRKGENTPPKEKKTERVDTGSLQKVLKRIPADDLKINLKSDRLVINFSSQEDVENLAILFEKWSM